MATTTEQTSENAESPATSEKSVFYRSGFDKTLRRQTTFLKSSDVTRSWWIVDATDEPLGRMATRIAVVLMGKHRPEYTAHVDTGDFVIVTNASKVALSGNKATQKYRKKYTGYPGGLKLEPWGRVRDRRPQLLVEDAVRRMLPKNRLGRQMLKKLRVVPGAEHPYEQQNPVELGL